MGMKMVTVNVKFYGVLRVNVVKEASRQFTLNQGDVETLINALIQHYGEELKEKLIDPETNQLTDRLAPLARTPGALRRFRFQTGRERHLLTILFAALHQVNVHRRRPGPRHRGLPPGVRRLRALPHSPVRAVTALDLGRPAEDLAGYLLHRDGAQRSRGRGRRRVLISLGEKIGRALGGRRGRAHLHLLARAPQPKPFDGDGRAYVLPRPGRGRVLRRARRSRPARLVGRGALFRGRGAVPLRGDAVPTVVLGLSRLSPPAAGLGGMGPLGRAAGRRRRIRRPQGPAAEPRRPLARPRRR